MPEDSGRSPRPLQSRGGYLARLAFGGALAGVAALSLLPLPDIARVDTVPGFDKLVHFFMYASLTVLALRACPHVRRRHLALALAAYGVALECVQGLLPARTLSAADVVANCTGISIMLYIAARRRDRSEAAVPTRTRTS
jgi:VanZ family protein